MTVGFWLLRLQMLHLEKTSDRSWNHLESPGGSWKGSELRDWDQFGSRHRNQEQRADPEPVYQRGQRGAQGLGPGLGPGLFLQHKHTQTLIQFRVSQPMLENVKFTVIRLLQLICMYRGEVVEGGWRCGASTSDYNPLRESCCRILESCRCVESAVYLSGIESHILEKQQAVICLQGNVMIIKQFPSFNNKLTVETGIIYWTSRGPPPRLDGL